VKPEDVDPANPLFAYHQKSYGGNEMLQDALKRLYRAPEGGFSPEDKIYLSLYNQARLVRRASEAWRVQMPHCMGELIWQLNDNWPVISWSMVEYGGKWKPLMYEAKRFFAPVAVFATSSEKGVVTLSAVNDSPKAVNAKATLRLMTFGGETLKTETFDAMVEPCNAVLLKKCSEDDFGNAEERKDRFLVIDVKSDDPAVKTFQTGWLFVNPKDCSFEHAEVKMESKNVDGKWLVELSTDKPAFGVWVNASGIKGEFDDNHFTLLPGEPRTLVFKPQDAATKFDDFRKSLTVKHVRQTY
jgi:beta-mannosidase